MFIVIVLLLLILPSQLLAANRYLSPTGNDSASGTTVTAPQQHFSAVINQLVAGDTLFLLDGEYTTGVTGLPFIDCSGPAHSGTSSARITMKSLNPRKAHLVGAGVSTIYLYQCDYWTIEDIYTSNIDVDPGFWFDGSPIYAEVSTNLIIRGNLAYGANAWFNSHCIQLVTSHNSLIERNELYYCHRHGVGLERGSNDNTVRLNYAHSRDHADIPGGFGSDPPGQGRGDTGVSCYPCARSLNENNIMEDWDAAFDIQCKSNCAGNRYFGNIALTNRFGYLLAARSEDSSGADIMPTNVVMKDNFSGSNDLNGSCVYARSNKNLSINALTCLTGTAAGVSMDQSDAGGDGVNSGTVVNTIIRGYATDAFYVHDQTTWSVDHAGVTSNGSYDPPLSDSHYTNTHTNDPVLGNCKVYLPAGSSYKGIGAGGADVGANILYQYQNATITTTPYWLPSGQFSGCGAIVTGINDVAGKSCNDVHQRLNVNFNGCALTYATTALPVPANFRMTP
jgi:hypothetical protein